jgi:Rrf2 family transcriptional regulator, nitric oxide-sensitive transcriptional repressor
MRLTSFTDYCLRALMLVALKGDELATIDEIAERYDINRNHLVKVVFRLGQLGYLETIRGKGGGVRLARDPTRINIGTLVRQTEEDFGLVECFQDRCLCVIEPDCILKRVLHEALDDFFEALDRYTLADLLKPRRNLARLLSLQTAS